MAWQGQGVALSLPSTGLALKPTPVSVAMTCITDEHWVVEQAPDSTELDQQ